MNWMQSLYETYDNCVGNEAIPDSDELCPVGYSVQNAHVEIVIDEKGCFRRASLVQKENAKTLIPVTEKSLTGRTSGIAPHALCDSIQYCAGDYEKYGGKRSSYFDRYITQLKDLAASAHSHPKVDAILTYVEKKEVVKDLVKEGILPTENGMLKVENRDMDQKDPPPIFKLLVYDDKGVKDLAKAFIRWSVESPSNECSATWKDTSLFESWRQYVDAQGKKEGICYVTGKKTGLARKHPARLRNGKDGAKLISSNDTSGYTFLGRFTSAEQAVGVSSEVTQKAHSALRWLIGRKHAFRSGDQAFVSWAVKGVDIPDPCANTYDFLGSQEKMSPSGSIGDVGQFFASRLRKKIAGYNAYISDSDHIVVMGLDSAVPGRMSITFYRELTGSEFLERIERWHSDFAWFQNYGKGLSFIGSPSPRDIAWAAYGKKIDGKSGVKLLNATVERLLPCIIDRMNFPQDIVANIVRRTSARNCFEKERKGNTKKETGWEKCLGIACSVYKGFNTERRYKMALEVERKTRDYLYGRLLAVGERIESTALSFANEQRETAAARFMQRFSDQPFSTWKSIENSLGPYKSRINSRLPGLLAGYEELLDEIHSLFIADDYTSNKPLSGEYLLGYHCQRKWLREHKREKGKWVEKTEGESRVQDSAEE